MSEAIPEEEIRVGYKRVQLGPKELEIPEEWTHTYFSDVIEVNPRYDKPDEGTFDYVPMDAVSEEEQRITYFTEREKDDCTTTWFKNGDTIYAKITPCAENGKIALVENVSSDLASGSTEFVVFHPKEAQTDPRFVFYLANLPQFRAVTISLMEGSTARQRIPNDIFDENIRIPVPPLSEQRRIAAVLSIVDEEIRQTEEIIEMAEELKRGLMQDFYSQGALDHDSYTKTTVGDRPEGWEIDRIAEHTKVISGSHVKSDLVSSDSSQTPYLTGPADFDGMGYEVTKYTDSPITFCEPSDTLVTVKGMGCGSSVFSDSRVCISRQLKAIRPRESLKPRYLFYWIRYNEEKLRILAEGTRQLGLSASDLETLPVPVPDLEEQKKIVNTLWTVEAKLECERKYKQQFR